VDQVIRQCLILAGGQGTRLAPVWKGPKTLVPVGGRPFALMQLEWLARGGVWEVLYLVDDRGEEIRAALGDAQFGMRLRYLADPPHAGTAGALRTAAAHVLRTTFVLYGDAWPGACLHTLANYHINAGLVMTVVENDDLLQPSNCKVRGSFLESYGQRGDHLDVGLLAFSHDYLRHLPPRGTLSDVLPTLAERGEIGAHIVPHRPHHVGDPQALAELESSLALR